MLNSTWFNYYLHTILEKTATSQSGRVTLRCLGLHLQH
ncbi:hypothetical protein I552_3164 [Mycobacterium xenopi 3993]|nr:hypothetical protein I552_3164 [Mycobacterium xenopi 3993]